MKKDDSHKEKTLLEITGPAIDMQFGIARMNGSEAMAKEMLKLMVKSLDTELHHFQNAYDQQDWEALKDLTHKLFGATCYCGTPRLKQACINLEDYLQTSETKQRGELYQQLLEEIAILQTDYQALF